MVISMTDLFPTGADVPKDNLRRHLWSGVANVQGFGAACDGVADDSGPLLAANGNGGATLLPPGQYRIAQDMILDNVILLPGAVLRPDAGKRLTVTGAFLSSAVECIGDQGQVHIMRGQVLPQWWGARGLAQAGEDDTAALSRAMALHDHIHLPWGLYGISAPLPLRRGMTITGEPWANGYMDWDQDWEQASPSYLGRASIIQYTSGQGALFAAADDTAFRDLVFRVGRQRKSSDRFFSAHAAHIHLENCKFEGLARVICDDTLGNSFGAIIANRCRFDGCGTVFGGPLVDCIVQACVFTSCDIAFDMTAGGGLNTIVGNRFEWGRIALQSYQTRPNTVTGNLFDAHADCAVKLHNAHNQTLSGNFFWRNGRDGTAQGKRSHIVMIEDVQAAYITGNTFLRGGADGSVDSYWPASIIECLNCSGVNTFRANQTMDGCSELPIHAPNWDSPDCMQVDRIDIHAIGNPGAANDQLAEMAKSISHVASAPVDLGLHESRKIAIYADLYGRKVRFVGARPGLTLDISTGYLGGILEVRDLTMHQPYGGTVSLMTAPAAPTKGSWSRGQIVWSSAPSAGGPIGWVCVTSGGDGVAVWKPFGTIAT